MVELDLIPKDYKQTQQLRLALKVFIIVFCLLIILIVIGKLLLENRIDSLGESIRDFEQKSMLLYQQQQQIADLTLTKDKLEGHVDVLNSLQNGYKAKQIFQVIDKNYVQGTWFEKFSFKQDEELKELNNSEEVNTGYFIIIKDQVDQNKQHAWRINANMEISGYATNHTLLANLVSNLISAPEINDVKVLNTSLSQKYTMEVVNFNLSISVNNHHRNKEWLSKL